MQSIDTILFDWDGTLIDSAQSSFNAFRKALGDLGISIDTGCYEEIYSPNWYNMYELLQLPREQWQEADDLWTRYYGKEIPTLVPGGQHVLRELNDRGYCLGIVTSGGHERVSRELNAVGLAGIFRIVVCSDDVVNKKPHPEGLERAMERMEKRPEVCCYVGDNPDDMEMGRRAHVRTIGILSDYPSSRKLQSVRPDFYFQSIDQLLGCFGPLSQPVLQEGLLGRT
jgi:HAD superfamily hydrolase (TIGR01549 family)